VIPAPVGGGGDFADDTTDTDSDDGGGGGGGGGGGYAEWRQTQADLDHHDEGYAGAIDTDDNDADAVVDEVDEVEDITEQSNNTAEEGAEQFDDPQPRDAVDDIPSDAAPPDIPDSASESNNEPTQGSGWPPSWWSNSILSDLDGEMAVVAVLIIGAVVYRGE